MTDWKDNEDVGKDYPDEEESPDNYEDLLEYLDELYDRREKLEQEMNDALHHLQEKLDRVNSKIVYAEEKLEEMDQNGDGT